MANLSLVFDLLGRDISASRAFNDVGNAADRTGKAGESAGSRISSGMKLAAAGLLGAGLIEGFGRLYNAAAESNRIGAITENVVRSTGGAAGLTAKQVGDLATSISKKTGADDEMIQSGETVLLTFTQVRNEVGKGNDVFSQATGLALDMSTVLGTDMSAASMQLGKALNDPIKGITALSRAGVSFTEQQKDQIRTLVESGDVLGAQKIILAELSKEFGGAAEAARTPLDSLKVTAGNLAEAVGGFLVPVVDEFASLANDDLVPAISTAASIAGGVLGPALHVAGEALGFIAGLASDVLGFFDSLPGPVQATIGVMGALVVFKGPIGSFFTTLKDVAETAALKVMLARDALGGMGSAGGVAKAGLGGLVGFLGGPWGLALTGATLGLSLLVSWLGRGDTSTDEMAASQGRLRDAIAATSGVIDDSVRRAAAKELQDKNLLNFTEQYGVSSKDMVGYVLGEAAAHDRVSEALQRQRQHIESTLTGDKDRDIAGRALIMVLDQQIATLDGLATGTDTQVAKERQLAEATGQTGAAMGATQGATAQLTASLQEEADAASAADQQINLLKTSLDVLTGANVTLGDAEAAVTLAMASATKTADGLSGAVDVNSGLLDRNTEAGAQVWQSLTRIGDADNQLISTMIQQGATTADVTARDATLRDSFIRTAEKMLGSRKAAEDLANQILGIPGSRTTTIIADTNPAQRAIDSFVGTLRSQGFFSAVLNLVPGHAYGGYTGDGGKFQVKGVVHGGEYVEPKESVSKYRHTGIFEALHHQTVPVEALRGLTGYAAGGFVPAPDFSLRVDMTQLWKDKMKKALEPGTGLVGALNWAKQQQGKPYIWAGVGPAGFDCSGFMSGIVNVIRGKNPNSRVGSTASFPWPGFAGGTGGQFVIGSTKNAFNSGIGHMAGTIMGINVESGSGHGPMVGGRALGAGSGLFTTRASFVRDLGGLLPPGSLGLNTSDRAERVLNGEQDAWVRRLVDANLSAPQQQASFAGLRIEGTLDLGGGLEARMEGVVVEAFTAMTGRGTYNP